MQKVTFDEIQAAAAELNVDLHNHVTRLVISVFLVSCMMPVHDQITAGLFFIWLFYLVTALVKTLSPAFIKTYKRFVVMQWVVFVGLIVQTVGVLLAISLIFKERNLFNFTRVFISFTLFASEFIALMALDKMRRLLTLASK